jgi:hypothetical protein
MLGWQRLLAKYVQHRARDVATGFTHGNLGRR